jgi:hypothetical protein|tara:strand:- start:163 stop:531 length:369 start_codon:yes stop_codon:yes gene_type:complete
MLLDDIEKNYPFISVVEYGGHEYVGVINNQDTAITSMFIFTDIPNAKSKEKFIELCKTWWFESNRMIPIGIYLRQEMAPFKQNMMMMNTKDVSVKIGPVTSLSNLAMKRSKRKSVQLVRKPK